MDVNKTVLLTKFYIVNVNIFEELNELIILSDGSNNNIDHMVEF